MAVDIQTIGFGADVSGLKDAQRELDKTERAAIKTADGADRLGTRFSALQSVTGMLKGVLAGIGLAALGKQFIDVADAVALMEARMKLATGNMTDFAAAQKEVYRISQAAQVGLQETATLYTRLADPVRRLGGGVRETSAMVEAFALTLRISGASTAEAGAATLQFSQALAAGALRGDEFNSIAETSPRLMKALATALGVNVGALRDMAKDGKLTADVVGNALLGALGDLRSEAEQLPDTVGGAMTQLSNMMQSMVGEFDRASGASGGLAKLLLTVLVPALKGAYTAAAGAYAVLQSVAHAWVGLLSAVSMATQGEFKLAWTMIKQIPTDIGKTVSDVTASIGRVWALSIDGATETTGAIGRLNGALGQTGENASKAAKEMKALLERERQMRELIDKAYAEDSQRVENEALQERLRLARANNDLFDEEFDKRERERTTIEGGIKSAREMVEAIEFEARTLAMSNTDREVAIALRQLEKLGIQEGTEAWKKYSDELRRAIGNRGAIRDGVEAAKEFEAEWRRTADQIGQSLSDALMGGGKSAAEYLKGLFRNLVLRPLLQPITAGVTGGWAGAASASGGGGSSLSSLASMAGSIGSLGSFAATGFMNTIAGTGMMSGLSAAGSLVSGGSIAGGIGMGLGAVAPYALAAYALYSLLGSGGEKRAGGNYGYSASDSTLDILNGTRSYTGGQVQFVAGPSGGQIGEGVVQASIAATIDRINALFDRVGSSERIDTFWAGLETSGKGRGGVMAGGVLSSGIAFGEDSQGSAYNGTFYESTSSRSPNADEAIAAFALDLQQATIQALQAAQDIPASVKSLLRDLDAEALSIEQTTAILTTIEAMQGFAEAARAMGLSADLVTPALVEAAGGLEGLRNAAQETMQSVGGMLDLIDSAVRDLYGASSAVGSAGGYQSLMSGAAFGRPEDFSSALASARGYLGDTTQFGSSLDQERARLQLAGYLDQYGRTTLQPLYDTALGIYGGPDPRTATATSGGLNALFSGDGSGTSKLEAEISALRDEQRAQASATVSALTGIRKIFERWDGDGMPDVRTV